MKNDLKVENFMFILKGSTQLTVSTGVNLSRTQRCCSPLCLRSQAQRGTY